MVNKTNFETINIDDFIHDPINQERVQSYPPELVGRFNSFIVTAFDDSMTVEMQIRTLIKWIKENIDVTMSALDNMEAFKQDSMAFQNHVKNTLVNLINDFTDAFDDNLKAETLEILTEWFNDGLLSDIVRVAINEEVINARGGKDSLGERLDESDEQLLNINNEVTNARGDKTSLGQRLDESDDKQRQTTTQLAQTDLKLSDVGINVRDFGVVPNDPNIDNHDAIISALEYATEHKIATLQFPIGETYTSPISMEGYQYIKFKGQSGFNYADHGSPTTHKETSIRFISYAEYGIQTAEPVEGGWSARGISFEDITLNGDMKVKHVVNAKYNTVFKNFVARGGIECGIVLENATYPVKLTDTHANFNGKHGLWVRSPFTTVYSIIDSEFSRNDGYGMLIEGSAGSSFKNITVQDNKQGGVKINSPYDTPFTKPVYLQSLGFDTLYTEANGQLETTHPNYEGNWALLITGVGIVRPRKIAFNNSSLNHSATGGTIKVDYGEDIYFDLHTNIGRKIEINRDKTRVRGIRFAPVVSEGQKPKITYYGEGESGNVFPTPYQTSDIDTYTIAGAWVGARGRTSIYEFYKSDIATWGSAVSMETQSGNGESYHTVQDGSILALHMTANNRSSINGSLNIEVQTRNLNNGTWQTLTDDNGTEMKYTWKTNESHDLLQRFTINRYKLSRYHEIRVRINSTGHNEKVDNNFTVNLLVEY